MKNIKIVVAFVCIHNSCRSQMAEGYAKALGTKTLDAFSAGIEKYPEVKPLAVKAMAMDGVDISDQYPKLLSDIPGEIDYLITMGCGVSCPSIPCKVREDWGIVDPSGHPIEEFLKARDIIKSKILDLIDRVS